MNTVTKTRIIAAGVAATVLTGIATLALPQAVAILAGLAIVGALVGMGAIEMKKRAY